MEFEPVIGLEVHTQLKTRSKIFCNCSTEFGKPPNTQVCPVCLGYPGVLPVMNEDVVRRAVKTSLMMHFTINRFNKMDRKNYFYPDLPKAYQISQFDMPIGSCGKVTIMTETGPKDIHITRVHMEEDAGKLMHGESGSMVDYNRTGVPLLEIVSEPDIFSSGDAYLYLKKIKQILEYGDISDCNMEEGSLRCDANVSVRPKGETKLGTKTEIKNVNSFRYVQKAIDFEIERQIQVLKEGGRVVQETRLFDASTGKTRTMRSKEEAHDYRYFPEPDLAPIVISDALIEEVKKEMPEHPDDKAARFVSQYGLSDYDASLLTAELVTANYFEECAKLCSNYKLISNWMMSELTRELNNRNLTAAQSPITPKALAELINLIEKGKISGKIAKDVLPLMFESGKSPSVIVEEKGLTVISDTGAIEKIIQDVLQANQQIVADYKGGKERAMGALVGQVMKASKGKASPQMVNELLKKALTA